MGAKERMEQFIKYKGLNNKAFEVTCGLGNGFVSKIGDSIRKEKLEKISLAFPELNIDWIINEKGEMLKGGDKSPKKSADHKGWKSIPLLPVSAQGGRLNDFVASVNERNCEKIVSPVRDADFAIPVSGDSMAPEYPNGSQVHVKRINAEAFIEWGRVYVLDTCNGAVIKRIVPSDKAGFVRCLSINPDPIYAPFEVDLKDVYGIYRVMLCLSIK